MDAQGPITVPYDASLRPETTYLPFNTINPGYGPIDIRVADNYTGNQPSQVWRLSPLLAQMPALSLASHCLFICS